jgi:hypothetical protein
MRTLLLPTIVVVAIQVSGEILAQPTTISEIDHRESCVLECLATIRSQRDSL